MATVTFNYNDFIAAYPQFNLVSSNALQNCFIQAELICNNSDASVVQDVAVRKTLLWLLVAHIATLMGQTNVNVQNGTVGQSAVVGRTNSASEGSVSISTEMRMNNNAAYFMQTQYGATYWQMILPYRSFRFRPRSVTII